MAFNLRKHLNGINEDIASGSGGYVVALFESRDPAHEYHTADLRAWDFDTTQMGVFRNDKLLGIFPFNRKVAQITSGSSSYWHGTSVERLKGCPADITEEEIKEAFFRGLEELANKLELAHNLFSKS